MKYDGEETTTTRVNQQRVPLYKLFSFADRNDVVLMTVGTICGIVNGCSRPFMAVLMGKTINTFGSTHPSQIVHQLSKICLMFIYLAIASGIAGFLQTSCWMVTGARQANRIRRIYLDTILRQDITFFDTETTTGEVIGRMSGDTILIQDAMSDKTGKFIQLAANFIGAFSFAFALGWRLTLVLLPVVPLIIIAGGTMAIVLTKLSTYGQVAYQQAGNVVEQTIGAIKTVASFTGEKHAMEKYDDRLKVAYAVTVKQGVASGFGIGVALLMVFFSYALAIWYGSNLIIDRDYNGGKIINVIFCVIGGGMSLGQASPCLSAFGAGQAAAYKMFETIKRKPKIDAYDSSGIVLKDIRGDIELKDVFFRYPARPEVQIFSGFSLIIPSGTTAALVGQSGSGKSTVISLLERFYDPDAGEVLIDGVDLKKLNLRCAREKIGLVSQEPILFMGSIRDNISYGKENATEEEIRTAIKLANAAKFIDKMPTGLDTMVGENGTQLSGGQKQRIAIARAILKNPRILLLDEATSALDAESERIVQDALQNIMVNRTTVVVAHRLTTIRNANNIAVVHQGKIVEQGTHIELIRNPDGAYSQLLRLQEGQSHQDPQLGTSKSNARDNSRPGSRSRSLSSQISVIIRDSPSSHLSYSLSSGIADPTGIIEMEFGGGNDRNTSSGEAKTNSASRASLFRLLYLNKPEFPVLILGSIAAGVHGVIYPVFGLLISTTIKIFYEPPHELKRDSKVWAGMFIGLGVLTLIALPLQNYLFGIAGGRLIQRICSLSFKKVVHQEISWFDDPENSSGSVGARLSTDASTVRCLVGDTLALVVQNLVTVAAGFIISFTANWILALIILSVLPLAGFQGYLQSKFLQGFSAEAKMMYEEASQVANDALSSIRTVASFCAEKKVMDLYQQKCEGPMRHGVRLGLVSGAGMGFSFFATYCLNAFCFYIGAVLVHQGKAAFSEVFRVFFALTLMALAISEASAMAPDTNRAKDSAASIFKLLDSKPEIDSSSEEGTTLSTVKGDIELQNVSFRYSTRPDVQIFRDLSLTIPAGKTVALVGESGCGKSTVITLLERFYNPNSGHILLDEIEIKNFKLSWLRQQMGLVNQEPALFNETIRTNISYGKHGEATEEEIIAATKAANAHNFISALPQGYDTSVGERGLQLSGGQKQRIAIARAILKDPRILLLDEATSALDAESERVVQDALDRVMVDRTTVVVAHRLATIKGADVIAVVRNGIIAEKGTHDELMDIRNGAYASLVALHMASST